MLNRINKHQAATAIAVFFHAIGLFGILFFDRNFFISTTPLNLLLSFLLLVWTQGPGKLPFFIFFIICFAGGMLAEIIGVNTGRLFGDYLYGSSLGPALKGVPWVIGINWFIIVYCCGIAIHTLLSHISKPVPGAEGRVANLKTLSVVVDGATIAVFFDWVMEPVAVKLGYWQWLGDGRIPFFNYLCWFAVSLLLLVFFHHLQFSKTNKFAIHLLMIQLMFFLLLRTFL